jgi:murein DD-endopeptidase MepM/ murein hydrolase activator NlpD
MTARQRCPTALAAAVIAAAALTAGALTAGAAPLAAATIFTGVFERGGGPYLLWNAQDWRDFEEKWRQLGPQGLGLVAVRAFVQGGRRGYVGAWREGGNPQEVATGLDAAAFLARHRELAGRGLQLVDLDTWLEGRRRLFLGAWRAGRTAQEVALALDGPALASSDEQFAARGLRPARIRAYRQAGRLRFLALWRAGEGDHQLLTGLDRGELARTQAELSRRGLQLADVDAYDDARGRRRYAGIWRAGGAATSLWSGEWESFLARWHERAGQGERLIALAVEPGACPDRCANQVVSRQPYVYGIRASASHCEGLPETCGAPGARDVVSYHWPVDVDGQSRFVRLSALDFHDAPFTLPFSDLTLKRRGVWLYGPGSWHQAADFSRDDSQTFAVRAAAAGRVIFIGWDSWSGNTLILSHDAGGISDAWRTIYMHLRGGASHDCEAAWAQTLAQAKPGDKEIAAYRVHLLATGCAQDAASRRLDPRHWGTEAQTIDPHLLGKRVAAGAFLAWAGSTGPGGKRGPGAPNTHLHVFFARRDPADHRWYFVDPYGIYGPPDCYPRHLADPVTSPCVRYPVAWAGRRPHLP